ncbi:TPA: restriction endonuclease subunit S [Klebsiella quasipneumoniae subsp. similipneumoniae]|nr:restriction endonuclease subunit S [Klebsiella quasipneumoniae subsp. similipneumoniae]
MAKYKAYPEYKDSGVEWLGEIPIHWEMLRHKYVAFFTKGKNPTNLLEQPLKNTLPYLSMECLRNNTTDKYALISNDVRIALEGQPLIIWDGSNAGEFVKGKSGILSSTMAAATLTYPLHPQYYWYVCISIEPEMRKNAVGMGIPHVNGDELKSISFGIPSFCEQKQIAVFLDHETAKIDNLIEKQQQLIELLKEKRQAVISHAVTKGLNPDVPMKDSGVEWLGEVPEHWDILPLQRLLKKIEQGSSPVAQNRVPENGEYGVLKISSIKNGVFIADEVKTLDSVFQYENRFKVKRGDLLVTRANTPNLVADACVIDKDTAHPVMMSDLIYRLDTTIMVNKDFLCAWLLSNFGRLQIKMDARGSSMTMAKVSQEHIKSWLTVLPPLEEQLEIISFINIEKEKLLALISKAELAINILQERRTALISAAVTGKIDVRDWVAPDTQDVEEPQEATA